MPIKDLQKRRNYNSEWISNRRMVFFKNKSCIKCGEKDITKLVLHHRDPDTKESHKIWSWSKKRQDEEILKCDTLCKKCHIELHATELRKHGTRSRYVAGCRCDACRSKMAECSRRWRENKKNRLHCGVEQSGSSTVS